MSSRRISGMAIAVALSAIGCVRAQPPAAGGLDDRLASLEAPAGFAISVFADALPNARSLARAPDGTIFVGTRKAGNVYAVRDADGDGRAERRWTLAEGLEMPNGVAFHEGALWVATNTRILRWDGILARLDAPPEPTVVYDGLPGDDSHGWRYLGVGPDGKLYVAIGAPCNVCDETGRDPRFGTIVRLDRDGSNLEIFARGVRNSVGFTWHPETGVLWFTDNGRDWLGDDRPPDELNRAPRAGLHFGFPHCHGRDLVDPEHAAGRECREFTPPVAELGPHVASLGLTIYSGAMFPSDYRGDVLIAEHGSWNRTVPIGYRLTRVRLDGDRAVGYEPFVTGWRSGRTAWGRPVDVLELPDGSLLVSDDVAGAVYRVTYAAPAPGS